MRAPTAPGRDTRANSQAYASPYAAARTTAREQCDAAPRSASAGGVVSEGRHGVQPVQPPEERRGAERRDGRDREPECPTRRPVARASSARSGSTSNGTHLTSTASDHAAPAACTRRRRRARAPRRRGRPSARRCARRRRNAPRRAGFQPTSAAANARRRATSHVAASTQSAAHARRSTRRRRRPRRSERARRRA